MRTPGIEPGPRAWKARILAVRTFTMERTRVYLGNAEILLFISHHSESSDAPVA